MHEVSPSLRELQQRFPGDARGRRHFLVTEVTMMKGGNICIAALDIADRRLIRPLQWNHHNWPSTLVQEGLRPGSVICQSVRSRQEPSGLPHQNEDTQFSDKFEIRGEIDSAKLEAVLEPLAKKSVQDIFNGNVIDQKFVHAVQIVPHSVAFL